MVEISNDKKNIIILFITMIIILLFIYKGFIADSDLYLKEYKNYLIKINATKYYFDKVDKNKNKKKKTDNEKIKELLLKIKKSLNKSININEKIIKNLSFIDFSKIKKIKSIINETIKYLNHKQKKDEDLLKVIEKYNIN